jgi:hypothetical protein
MSSKQGGKGAAAAKGKKAAKGGAVEEKTEDVLQAVVRDPPPARADLPGLLLLTGRSHARS